MTIIFMDWMVVEVGELIDGENHMWDFIFLFQDSFLPDFSCAVESSVLLHGRMYVTNRFLCFYSNLFGLVR